MIIINILYKTEKNIRKDKKTEKNIRKDKKTEKSIRKGKKPTYLQISLSKFHNIFNFIFI